jgi:xanthine dehydrogenase accessory factor
MGVKSFWEFCRDMREAFQVVTLVSGRGHVPQDLGAKAIITESGLVFGTVGGGKVEAKAIQWAQERIKSEKKDPELLCWNLQRDVGMTCGGEMTLLFESHGEKKWQIAVFGAGHVAQSLVPLLGTLDCRVFCIDPREEWLKKMPEFSNLEKICEAEPKKFVKKLGEKTFFVCVSQGHSHDVPVLEEIARSFEQVPFVGVIGSETKASAIRRDLLAKGVSEHFIEKIRCPIGLDIGSNHTGEIAVSIAAQLLQVRDQIKF